MRLILIPGLMAIVGGAGWNIYSDGHLDLPAAFFGPGEAGLSLSALADVGFIIRALAASAGCGF